MITLSRNVLFLFFRCRGRGRRRTLSSCFYNYRAHLTTLNVSFPRKRDTEGGRSQSIKINTMDPRFRGDDTVNRGALYTMLLAHAPFCCIYPCYRYSVVLAPYLPWPRLFAFQRATCPFGSVPMLMRFICKRDRPQFRGVLYMGESWQQNKRQQQHLMRFTSLM